MHGVSAGLIDIATVLGPTGYERYRYTTKVKTGPLRGEELLLSYRGAKPIRGDVIVLLYFPVLKEVDATLREAFGKTGLVCCFISSEIPDGFESGSVKNTLIHGKWEWISRGLSPRPLLGDLEEVFHLEGLVYCVSFEFDRGLNRPVAYGVGYRFQPRKGGGVFEEKPVRKLYRASTRGVVKPKSLVVSLKDYLRTMNKWGSVDGLLGSYSPRFVVSDEVLDQDRVNEVFIQDSIRNQGIEHVIEAEPNIEIDKH